jgi:predicted O-methyltransferase YrrM
MDKAESVLKRIEGLAPKNGWPIIGPERGRVLAETVKRTKPKRILEVGTLVGYSAIRMARVLPEGGVLTAVEHDPSMVKIARENIASAGLAKKVEILEGDAKKILPTLNVSFDLVFIDAAKEEYFIYLKMIEPRLHRGSVVIADNALVFAREMGDYLTYVRESGRYRSEYFEPEVGPGGSLRDGIEVSELVKPVA